MKMWSGRFSQAPDAEFEQWQRSFPFDRMLLPYEVAASKAHASALAKAGVLTGRELAATLFALDQIAREGVPAGRRSGDRRRAPLRRDSGWSRLRARSATSCTPAAAATSRSRPTCGCMCASRSMRSRGLLAEFASAQFVKQAEAAGDSAMPAYTHLQRAEPVLVAHWLLAYVEMFLRDIDRLADCRKRLNVCPLGSGAVAGTILPLDREAIAAELEFDAPTANSMDATSDRDFAIEFVQALSFVALHLSRWAEEFILFSTTEFGFVKLPEQYSTGSSAMPQKKNPDALELIRGKAGKVFAEATALFIGVKGLPLAYNKDMQETQQPVFAAAQQVASMVRVATGFMATVEFNYDRMQQAASCGFMNAQAAAAYLVRQGVPFRRAHELIGKAVRLVRRARLRT